MSNDLSKSVMSPFERIKRINEFGSEYWSARELMKILEYAEYKKNFVPVIKKAIKACEKSGENKDNHFAQVGEMVEIGSNAKRELDNYHLSRYACYLIVQNADSDKETIALGQTYFAVQTRKQEILEQAEEDEKRFILRQKMKEHNNSLMDAAKEAGVVESIDYAIFQNHGYKGLYGGLGAQEIRKYKGIEKNKNILDHMGVTELAANFFRATQTEEKLKREKIRGKQNANKAHLEVGARVRKTIKDIGGTMPEDLPVYEDINKVAKKKKYLSKSKNDEITNIIETKDQVIPTSESLLHTQVQWSEVLSDLKSQGRMALFTYLIGTKAVYLNNTLFIGFDSGRTLNKMVVSKAENLSVVKDSIERIYKVKGFEISVVNIDELVI